MKFSPIKKYRLVILFIVLSSITCLNIRANEGILSANEILEQPDNKQIALLEKELVNKFNLKDYSCSIEEVVDCSQSGILGVLFKFRAENNKNDSLLVYNGLALSVNNNPESFVFVNPNTFFCEGCNNATFQDVNIDRNKLSISINWGPSINPQFDWYDFISVPSQKDWLLVSVSGNEVDTRITKTYLSKFNAELVYSDNYVVLLKRYTSKDIPRIAKILKDTKRVEDLDITLTEKDAADLVDNLNNSNLQLANDCGYYLEQLNMVEQAIIILEKVISAYPNRMVAYLNLGDAYSKKNTYYETETKEAYDKYVALMKSKGLESKIPNRVIEYLEILEQKYKD